MFTAALKSVKLAMFPVFYACPTTDEGKMEISVRGAAFFIDERGTFITCAHVVPRHLRGGEIQYRGRPPEFAHNPTMVARELHRDESRDIFIGKIDIESPGHLGLGVAPDVGRSVCICGYPLADLQVGPNGMLMVGRVRRYFQPTFVIDVVRLQDGNLAFDYDALLMRDFGLFGMSGGPAVDVDGLVVGMQSAVTPTRISIGGEGRRIAVENGIAVTADELRHAVNQAGCASREGVTQTKGDAA
jgi:S1-C subfamily serine protease